MYSYFFRLIHIVGWSISENMRDKDFHPHTLMYIDFIYVINANCAVNVYLPLVIRRTGRAPNSIPACTRTNSSRLKTADRPACTRSRWSRHDTCWSRWTRWNRRTFHTGRSSPRTDWLRLSRCVYRQIWNHLNPRDVDYNIPYRYIYKRYLSIFSTQNRQ